jgi:histidinol-phosphate phosphatase family protein
MSKRILVIRFSSLGDVVLTEPVFRALKESCPDSSIGFVTKREYSEIFEGHPLIDRIFAWSGDFKELIAEVKAYEPDLIVDLHRNYRSRRLTSQFPEAQKLAYPKARWERFLKVLTKNRKPAAHSAERYLLAINSLLERKGGSRAPLQRIGLKVFPKLDIWPVEDRRHRMEPSGFTIGFGLGAKWETKRWPVGHFAALAQMFQEKHPLSRFVLFGSEEEYGLGMRYKEEYSGGGPAVFVFGQSLSSVKRCLSRLDMLVSNDSGLMHLGAAQGVPTLGLFGPTHPVLGFAPLGEQSKGLTLNLYCSPCSLHGRAPCFRLRRFCLEDLRPGQILEEGSSILGSSAPKPIPKPAPTVFLDRDGTLIKERDFDYTPENIEILPGAPEALKKLKAAGFRIVAVSNQSGVGRGFFPAEAVRSVHRTINEKLKPQGAEIDRFYFCPHWPGGKVEKYRKECFCRKPRPGMLGLADLELGVDFTRSFLMGDRVSDLELGKAKGLRSILVRTGQGREAEQKLGEKGENSIIVRENIFEAAEYIVGQGN